MNSKTLITLLIVAAVLGGCVSNPTSIDQLGEEKRGKGRQ
jgi:hypothetical protein